MQIRNIRIRSVCIVALFIMVSCKTSKVELAEPQKDISGVWQIAKLVQNGVDVTLYVDYSDFKITFNKDNTYDVNGDLPFIVNARGTWAFNDPQYPFSITFIPDDTNEKVLSKLAFPIVGSKYQIGLNFIIGCRGSYQNTYQYTLKQVKE